MTPGGGWEQLQPWLTARVELPVGPLFCVIDGLTCGRPWSSAAVRVEFTAWRPRPACDGASRSSSKPAA